MNQFVEIRSYNLKSGTRNEFHRLFLEQSMPLLRHWNVDVVAYGPSLHDDTSYYLIRRFDSLAQRSQIEAAFYNSAAWRQGPRQAVLACIESYAEIVIEMDAAAVQGLRERTDDSRGT